MQKLFMSLSFLMILLPAHWLQCTILTSFFSTHNLKYDCNQIWNHSRIDGSAGAGIRYGRSSLIIVLNSVLKSGAIFESEWFDPLAVLVDANDFVSIKDDNTTCIRSLLFHADWFWSTFILSLSFLSTISILNLTFFVFRLFIKVSKSVYILNKDKNWCASDEIWKPNDDYENWSPYFII